MLCAGIIRRRLSALEPAVRVYDIYPTLKRRQFIGSDVLMLERFGHVSCDALSAGAVVVVGYDMKYFQCLRFKV